MFQFYFLTIYLKKVVWRLRILFMSDIVLSASRYTVLFDLFAVHEIPNILPGYLISDAFTLICSYFEIVQNSHLEIQNGFNIVLQAFPLIWIEMYFVSTEVIAWKSVLAFAILHKISVLLRRSHDIKVSKYLKWLLCLGLVPVDEDVDLWTLTVSTDDHYLCLFAVIFQPFLLQQYVIIVPSLLYFLTLMQCHHNVYDEPSCNIFWVSF